MTKDRKRKQEVRALAARLGISYTEALRRLEAGPQPPAPPPPPHEGAGHTGGDEDWDSFDWPDEASTVEELVRGALEGECDRLFQTGAHSRNGIGTGRVYLDLDLPSEASEPYLSSVVPDLNSSVFYLDEEFDGGTVVGNVTVEAEVTVEALMPKARAYAAHEGDEVELADPDFNEHYALVCVEERLELRFLATVDPFAEMVENLELDETRATAPRRP